MHSVRFNCKTSLHLIVQPEENLPRLLNDLNANDTASSNFPPRPEPFRAPNFRVLSCAWPSTPLPPPKVPHLLLLPRLPLLLPLPRHRPLRQRRPNRRSLLPPRSNRHSQRNNRRSSPRRRPSDGQTPDGQDVNTSDAPPAEKNRNTAKAEAKLEKALEYLATLNTTATAKPDKWVVNASILASMTGCYRPAINTFIEAHKQRIDELNAAHGLGPGHNRATARTHPNAIPELVKRFKEEILGQPF
jgi:hypothetical protein